MLVWHGPADKDLTRTVGPRSNSEKNDART